MLREIFFPGPLSEIEKLIVYRKIKKIGKEMILQMIESANNSDTHNSLRYLPTLTKVRKNKTDDFATFIISTIEEQEKELKYIPHQVSEVKDDVWHITLPTNYLGNYTRYWHKTDTKGEYLELYSLFIDKPALMEVICNY
jgi:hypothetical protein